MSNTWFQFRNFTLQQDRCAMKITTDACIQGAWTPLAPMPQNVLDIGTGTGLLALMLAQRFPEVHIDAVEYDQSAAAQAQENTDASPFAARIRVINADIRSFSAETQYDNIICNPGQLQCSTTLDGT
jgi:tRNA1Val (adenine37-N6)-methyltransferase